MVTRKSFHNVAHSRRNHLLRSFVLIVVGCAKVALLQRLRLSSSFTVAGPRTEIAKPLATCMRSVLRLSIPAGRGTVSRSGVTPRTYSTRW